MRVLFFYIMLFFVLCSKAQIVSAVRDCKGQRELGKLEGTYIYNKGFSDGNDAYIQCWRTNTLTPQGQTDSLSISDIEKYCFSEKIDGEYMYCKVVFHRRIIIKGLKIFYQKYKKDNKIDKEPKYYVSGTYECWAGDFGLNFNNPLASYDEKKYSNFDTNKIGRRFRKKIVPHDAKMEITKDLFDWLHKFNSGWKITEVESDDVRDYDEKSSGLGFFGVW